MAWAMGAGGSPTPTAERFVRYVNRDNTLAASMKTQAVVIETTAYTQLRGIGRRRDAGHGRSLAVLVDRRGGTHRPALRPRDPSPARAWMAASSGANWIAEPLLGPQRIAPGGLTLTEWQGAAVYREAQPGKSMIVRYGPGVGQALDPNYHLRRTMPAQQGPFFLLDIDSFWTPAGSIPEYDRNAVLTTFQDLYEPARTVFQEMLTSRLEGRPAPLATAVRAPRCCRSHRRRLARRRRRDRRSR